jgi:rhomboid family GlyGly-CTERM serine protease
VVASARLSAIPVPIWTLLLCGVAGSVFCLPLVQAALVYNRAAIADGEFWRLVTGNLVHLSTPHFLYDVVALLVAGALIEMHRYRHFAILCLVSGFLTGVTLYVAMPEIIVFGGLSGVVTAAVTYLCLHGVQQGGAWKWLCLLVLVCLVAKLGVEMAFGFSLTMGAGTQTFVPVPVSHAVGAVTSSLLFVLAGWRDTRPNRRSA